MIHLKCWTKILFFLTCFLVSQWHQCFLLHLLSMHKRITEFFSSSGLWVKNNEHSKTSNANLCPYEIPWLLSWVLSNTVDCCCCEISISPQIALLQNQSGLCNRAKQYLIIGTLVWISVDDFLINTAKRTINLHQQVDLWFSKSCFLLVQHALMAKDEVNVYI